MKKILLTNIKMLSVILIILLIINVLCINKKQIIQTKVDNILASSDIKFDDWKNEDYWEWHTRTTTDDKAYNGNHIEIKEDVIDFYGYGVVSYKDFLYKDYKNSGNKIFRFVIDESKANYHTLEGAGLLFNSNIIDNKLSGYVLLFTQNNLELYRLDDVDTEVFENTANTKVSTYGTLIKSALKTNSNMHALRVQVSPTNISVNESGIELLNENLDMSIHIGEGFGLISSYVQHNCSKLSTIEFSDFGIEIVDYEIFITNIDENKNAIPSKGYFQLLDENGTVVREGYTDSNGKFNIDGLQQGTYELKQTITPNGYEKNEEVITINISSDGKIVNEKGEEIKIDFVNKKIINKPADTDNTINDEGQDDDKNNISKDEGQDENKDGYNNDGIDSDDDNQGDKELGSSGNKEDENGSNDDKQQGGKEENSTNHESVNNKEDDLKTDNNKKPNLDSTIANKIIPKTGKVTNAIRVILIISLIVGIYSFMKLKSGKYKF